MTERWTLSRASFSSAVRDAAVLRVAGRVTYELDETIDYPRRFIGDVAITLADGRSSRVKGVLLLAAYVVVAVVFYAAGDRPPA